MTDAALKLLAVVLYLLAAAAGWTGLLWLLARPRRCCTGTPSTHWLADRCDECGRRHHRRTA